MANKGNDKQEMTATLLHIRTSQTQCFNQISISLTVESFLKFVTGI